MNNEEANKKIHTFLGKCWHEPIRRNCPQENYCPHWYCSRCGDHLSDDAGNQYRLLPPDYFTDYKAAREFWSKVCETEEGAKDFWLWLWEDIYAANEISRFSYSQMVRCVALMPVEVGTKAACRAAGIEVEG